MIVINGKEYEINLDIKWGTQKLMRLIQKNPQDPKADKYTEMILKDILIPSPSNKELFDFRRSDIEAIFEHFAKEAENMNSDFKKKRSQ